MSHSGKKRIIALVASEAREFHGVLRRIGPGEPIPGALRFARRVEAEDTEWLLLADGQGTRAAARACAAIPNSSRLEGIGSIGYCGGTRDGWNIADVLLASEVVEQASGERFPCWRPPENSDGLATGILLTADRIVRLAAEKQKLGAAGFDAVEMEAAAVARVARERGVRFFALKAVSDTAAEDLGIDFDRARRNDGSIRVGSVLAQALQRPLYGLPTLGRLARAARLASENMGVALATIRF